MEKALGILLSGTLMALLYVFPFVDETGARNTLKDRGYKNVEILGRGWQSCGRPRGERFRTLFEADGRYGKRVQGIVCGSVVMEYPSR